MRFALLFSKAVPLALILLLPTGLLATIHRTQTMVWSSFYSAVTPVLNGYENPVNAMLILSSISVTDMGIAVSTWVCGC